MASVSTSSPDLAPKYPYDSNDYSKDLQSAAQDINGSNYQEAAQWTDKIGLDHQNLGAVRDAAKSISELLRNANPNDKTSDSKIEQAFTELEKRAHGGVEPSRSLQQQRADQQKDNGSQGISGHDKLAQAWQTSPLTPNDSSGASDSTTTSGS